MRTVLAMARKAADHTDEAQVTTESELREVRFSTAKLWIPFEQAWKLLASPWWNTGGKWDSQKCLSTSIADALTHLSLMK